MRLNTIGYLIDPLGGFIQRVKVSDYKDIYKWIGADCFDVARFANNGDGVFVDDDGLLKQQDPENFFIIADYPNPLAGKGLVLGVDDEGESVEPKTPWVEFITLVKGAMVLNINGVVTAIASPLIVKPEIGELP